jgi:hypothetical protein
VGCIDYATNKKTMIHHPFTRSLIFDHGDVIDSLIKKVKRETRINLGALAFL